MNYKTHSYPKFHKTLPVLLIILTLYTALIPEKTFAYEMSLFSWKSDSSVQDDFDKKFREARELQDAGDFAKAAARFYELIAKYPNNKSTDAALYWLAFCQKKQKQYLETNNSLARLMKDFPNSSWVSDAKVMMNEIAPEYIALYMPAPSAIINGQRTGAATIENGQTFQGIVPFGPLELSTAKVQLDREDEIKLAAFQSLLSADLQKGITVMSEILAPNSKASENLKLGVIRAARRPFSSNRTYVTGESLTLAQTLNNTSSKLNVAQLREPLVRIFQSEPNIKIRKEIIFTLASSKDDESVNYLGRLYNSESDREVKKAIINGLGSSGEFFSGVYTLAPATSITGLGTTTFNMTNGATGGTSTLEPSVTAKGQATASAPAEQVKVINNARAASQSRYFTTDTKPRPEGPESKVLKEIARSEKDDELRRLALSTLMRMGVTDVVDLTIRAYDSENDENYRRSLIQTLGRSKSPEAARKLMDITRNDKSDKLRLAAISALQNTNTPEVTKFLEDLIK